MSVLRQNGCPTKARSVERPIRRRPSGRPFVRVIDLVDAGLVTAGGDHGHHLDVQIPVDGMFGVLGRDQDGDVICTTRRDRPEAAQVVLETPQAIGPK